MVSRLRLRWSLSPFISKMWTWWVSRSSSAPVRRSEPNHVGPFVEEEFRAGGGQGHVAQFVDDQQAEAGQLPLEVEQRYLIPGFPVVRFTSFSPARRPSHGGCPGLTVRI